MKFVVLTEGFYPPWTEGSRNILLGWLASMLLYRPVDALVFTTLDPKDSKPALEREIYLRLNNSSNIYIKFIPGLYSVRSALYKTRPPTQLDLWQRFVESYTRIMNVFSVFAGVEAVKSAISRSTICKVSLILHNPGSFTIKQLLPLCSRGNSINVIITLTFAEVCWLRNLLTLLAKVARKSSSKLTPVKIVASSPYIGALIRTILSMYKIRIQTYIDVLSVFPIPVLGNVIRKLGLCEFVAYDDAQAHKLLDYVVALTERYDHIVLYMGQLNEVRLPSALLMRLCRVLEGQNAAVLIIAPPSHQSRMYLSKIEMQDKPSNLYVLLHPLDPDTKERILELIDLVILPYKADGRSVIDPPLVLLESLVKGKPVITFDTISVRTLTKLAGFEHIILPKSYEEFVNCIVNVLSRDESRMCGRSINTILRSLTDPSVVGATLVRALCD